MARKQMGDSEKKVPFFSSMKFRISVLSLGGAFLSTAIVLIIVAISVRGIIKDETLNYLFDVARSNGNMIETMYEVGFNDVDLSAKSEDKAKLPQLEDENEQTPTDNKERHFRDLNHGDMLEERFSTINLQGIDSSYAYLVDADGVMIYHPTKEKIGQPVENSIIKGVVEELENGGHPESKVVTYDYDGTIKYAAYYIDKNESAILVVTADEDEVLASINRVVEISVVVFLIVITVVTVAGIISITMMLRPITRVTEIVGKMAHLDFTENEGALKLISRKDETGMMSRAVASLRREIIAMMEQIQEESKKLYHASETLEKDAGQTAKTVEQVECAVNDIASGATSQAQETQNATEHVVVMGQMIEETNSEAERLEDNSQKMQTSSDQAISILNELIHVNEKTKGSVAEIYEQTSVTNESAEKIKEATVLIASIAEETNLLSLNATIEAARAGEQGRGFAVVAAQIQKLAEQSNESAAKIDTITNDLMNNSSKAVEIMHLVRESMDQQSEKMAETEQMFEEVNGGVKNALDGVVKITEKTEGLNESRRKVVDVVQNLSAIAQENAASSEETSASVAQVSSVVADISENSVMLRDIAYQLDQSIQKFKL